jgi:putative transposase
MRTRYKALNNESLFFITSTIVDWIPIFTSDKYYNILIDTIKFYQSKNKIQIFAYVFLEEHFHMIVKSNDFMKTVQLIKMYSAKEIIRNLKDDKQFLILDKLQANKKVYKTNSEYQVWQEGYKPKEILTEKMLEQKINYIHYNPVKKGYVTEMEKWKYSSAGYYINGEVGVLEIDKIYQI